VPHALDLIAAACIIARWRSCCCADAPLQALKSKHHWIHSIVQRIGDAPNQFDRRPRRQRHDRPAIKSPWQIAGELAYFKRTTIGTPVIMGTQDLGSRSSRG